MQHKISTPQNEYDWNIEERPLCSRQNVCQLSLLSCAFPQLLLLLYVFYRKAATPADRFNPSVHLRRSHYQMWACCSTSASLLPQSLQPRSAKASHFRVQRSVVL